MKKFFTLLSCFIFLGLVANAQTSTLSISGVGGSDAWKNVVVANNPPFLQYQAYELSSNSYTMEGREFYVWGAEGYDVDVTSNTSGMLVTQSGTGSVGAIRDYGDYTYVIYKIGAPGAQIDIMVKEKSANGGGGGGNTSQTRNITINFSCFNKSLYDEATDEYEPVNNVISQVSFNGETINVTNNSCVVNYGSDYTGSGLTLTAELSMDGYYISDINGIYKTSATGMEMSIYPNPSVVDGVLSLFVPVNAYSIDVNIGMASDNPDLNPDKPSRFAAYLSFVGQEITRAYQYVSYSSTIDGSYTKAADSKEVVSFSKTTPLSLYFKTAQGYKITGMEADNSFGAVIWNKVENPDNTDPYTGYIEQTEGVWSIFADGEETNADLDITIYVAADDEASVGTIGKEEKEQKIYRLNGNRVSSSDASHGVFIINGKKVVK